MEDIIYASRQWMELIISIHTNKHTQEAQRPRSSGLVTISDYVEIHLTSSHGASFSN
jgi:hypothetical protein